MLGTASARGLIAAIAVLLASCAARTPVASVTPSRELPLVPAAAPVASETIITQQSTASIPPGSLPAAATSAAVPLTFERAAPDGHWLVSCQAREDSDGDGALHVIVGADGELRGDELVRYLTFDSGSELVIDSLLASSADGRWLVIEREGRSELLDSSTGQALDLSALGADTRRFAGQSERHRTLVFDGERLLYVRGGHAWELVERQLTSGAERVLLRGNEPLVRFWADAAGVLLIAEVKATDAGRKAEDDLPYALTTGKSPCRGPLPHYLAPHGTARASSYWVLDRVTGELVRADDFAVAYGKLILRRDADGVVFALNKYGRRVFAPRDCAGRVLWMDPRREQLLLGCALPKKPGRLGVELLSRGQRTALEIDVAALPFDEPAGASERLAPLYPGADVVLFDAEKRLLHRLKSGDAVLATRGAHALVRRGRTLLLFDAETGTAAPLAGSVDPFGNVLVQGSLVLASPLVVDVATGSVRGSVTGAALALSSGGDALVPAVPASASSLAIGPLTWQHAE